MNIDISPSELNQSEWEAIEIDRQQRLNSGARNLANFLQNECAQFVTEGTSKDPKTAIFNQCGKSYNMDPEHTAALFAHLDTCRREQSKTFFAERQAREGDPYSGIMFDFDIVTRLPHPKFSDQHYKKITALVTKLLRKYLQFPEEYEFKVFFIVKPAATAITGQQLYKYGIHVLVPGIKVGRSVKRLLIKDLSADQKVHDIMAQVQAVEPEKCLDTASAHVPVMLFGSSKKKVPIPPPYVLDAAYSVIIDDSLQISALEGCESYNLVAELSILHSASYPDRPPLVKKEVLPVKKEYEAAAISYAERAAGDLTAQEELATTDAMLTELFRQIPLGKTVYKLLDLLTPDYYTEYGKWVQCLFVIKNVDERLKCLAEWFSQKCPDKWVAGGQAAVDKIWADRTSASLTIRSLHYWAKNCNAERYRASMFDDYYVKLSRAAFEFDGRLEDYSIASILFEMLGAKFCTVISTGSMRAKTYTWYEFVHPDDKKMPGQVWKWRQEPSPTTLHLFISDQLADIVNKICEDIKQKRDQPNIDIEYAKYYKELLKNLKASLRSLLNYPRKCSIIREAEEIFRSYEFASLLDQDPNAFGVSNGVISLGRKCRLINHHHEIPISKFTNVAYVPFDPHHPTEWQRIVLDGIARIIPEADARDWILYHAAQGLSGKSKEGVLLLWIGGGENGKTTFLRWVHHALGAAYSDKFNIDLFSAVKENPSQANSALARLKHLQWAYAEESNKSQVLNPARLKELVNCGEISNRDLHKEQETTRLKANYIAASQHSFIINTYDHGTWRRIWLYTSKTKFRKNPDPNCPLEFKADSKYNDEYPSDPCFQSAMLSILVYYYERLQNEHGGCLKNVPTETIDRETAEYRISQDSIHRWVSEVFVCSDMYEYPLATVANHYREWYFVNIEHKHLVVAEISNDIELSVLGKYLQSGANGSKIIRGCRMLTQTDPDLHEDETYMINVRQRGGSAKKYTIADGWWLPPAPKVAVPPADMPEPAPEVAEPATSVTLAEDKQAAADEREKKFDDFTIIIS